MQHEDKIRSGVDERLLHLVIGDGSTVSEHVQTLSRDEQAEFAEFRTAGKFVIRPSDELETAPRDTTEARQSTPEFAFIARRSADRDFVFQDTAQAREFVDLIDRLVGENPDGESRRVWAREMYGRFLYERDAELQQVKLAETMQQMREWAAEIAPLDPGRNALAYMSRVHPAEYSRLMEEHGPNPQKRALNYVRSMASRITGIHDGTDALATMRRRDPAKWGDVKGRTQSEREQRAFEFLSRHEKEGLAEVTRFDAVRLQREALEFLRQHDVEAYDRCNRWTPERMERELDRDSQSTTYFDPERLSTGNARAGETDRAYFSLADQRSAGASYEEARVAFDTQKLIEQGKSLAPEAYGNLLDSFELGDKEPGKAALAFVRQQALAELQTKNSELHSQLVAQHKNSAPQRALKVMQREDPERYGIFKGASETERESLALEFCRQNFPADYTRIHHEALEIAVGHATSHEQSRTESISPAHPSSISYEEAASTYADSFAESQANSPEVTLTDLDPLERDDHEDFAVAQEFSFHEIAEAEPGMSIHESGRMGAEYIVVGEIFGVPPAPQELLERYPEIKAAFDQFEERISSRIWNGESISKIYAGFHEFMDNLRIREMSDEALSQIRQHLDSRNRHTVERTPAEEPVVEKSPEERALDEARAMLTVDPAQALNLASTLAYETLTDNRDLEVAAQAITVQATALARTGDSLYARQSFEEAARVAQYCAGEIKNNLPEDASARKASLQRAENNLTYAGNIYLTAIEELGSNLNEETRAYYILRATDLLAKCQDQGLKSRLDRLTTDRPEVESQTKASAPYRRISDSGTVIETRVDSEQQSIALSIARVESELNRTQNETRRAQLHAAAAALRERAVSLAQSIGREALDMVESNPTVQAYAKAVHAAVSFVEDRHTQSRINSLRQSMSEIDPSDTRARNAILRELLPLRQKQLEKERDRLTRARPRSREHAEKIGARLDHIERQLHQNLSRQQDLASHEQPAASREAQAREENVGRTEQASQAAPPDRAAPPPQAPAVQQEVAGEYRDLTARIEIASIFAARVESMLDSTRAQSASLSSRALSLEAINSARDGSLDKSQKLFHQSIEIAAASGDSRALERAQQTMRSELGAQSSTSPRSELPAHEEQTRAAEKQQRDSAIARLYDDISRLDQAAALLETRLEAINHERSGLVAERGRTAPPQEELQHTKSPIYVEDGHGHRIGINTEQAWTHYTDHLKQYHQIRSEYTSCVPDSQRETLAGEVPSDPAVYSTSGARYISSPQVEYNPTAEQYENRDDLVQLEAHFSKRMTELTKRDQPELSRISSDWRFREAALIMRQGFDTQTGRDARQVLAGLHVAGRASRGRDIATRGFSRSDLKLLETIYEQSPNYQVIDRTQHIKNPEERGRARAQIRHEQAAERKAELELQHSIEVRLKADLVTRAERHGHTGIDLFFALTKNKTMRSGAASPLYEPFNKLPDTKRSEIYQFARELREQVNITNMNAERAAITEVSPTLRAYIETYKHVTSDPNMARADALKETWKQLEERVGQLQTYPKEDKAQVFHIIEDTKEKHERLERLSAYRASLWTQAEREAQRVAASRNMQVPSLKSSQATDASRNGQSQSHLPHQGTAEKQIYNLVSADTKKALNTIERSVATVRLEIARNFTDLDAATRLRERAPDRSQFDRDQVIRDQITSARAVREQQHQLPTINRTSQGRNGLDRQDPLSPTRSQLSQPQGLNPVTDAQATRDAQARQRTSQRSSRGR